MGSERTELIDAMPFAVGAVETPAGSVPRVEARLTARDYLGAWRVRWGIGRGTYRIPPGLYALGSPDSNSDVLVTANYKLSFDKLRQALPGRAFWILVLNTNGVNVWCAAGKGTFGTAELVDRITASNLTDVVSHRRLILPQLGAPGVAAHDVKKESGFKVIYGPIRSRDIPAFMDAGLKATDEMRRKTFPVSERMAIIPVELVQSLKILILVMATFFFLSGLGQPYDYWANTSYSGILAVAATLAAVIGGTVLVPLLLPWLPGRAFSLKGMWAGLAVVIPLLFWLGNGLAGWPQCLETAAWLLMVPALSAFLGMNFTGASTYTSLSGVRKEMRIAVPFQIGAGAVGLILWFASRFTV